MRAYQHSGLQGGKAPALGDERRRPAEIRVARMLARLNIGGPASQAILLTERMAALGYRTTLMHGVLSDDEGSFAYLAEEHGVAPVLIPGLQRDPTWRDLPALVHLARLLRREPVDIVHTHAAKAGALGRLASLLADLGQGRRAVRIHTFHGHSLTGYFGGRVAAFYRAVERFLARYTDRLVAVSPEVRDELVALGVAPSERFVVIPEGPDLEPFRAPATARESSRAAVRRELGIPADAVVLALIARVVPIKRIDRFLRACAPLQELRVPVRFLVVGDGQLRGSLSRSPAATALGLNLIWTGFRRDVPELCFASDIAVLTSDREGMPVSLLEAAAAGLPLVSTAVGGASTVIRDGVSGRIVAREDEAGLARALRGLVLDPDLRARMGGAGRVHVAERFGMDRLVAELDGIYRELLAARGPRRRERLSASA